jgi:GMP synthase (glutamine-hydrolysing)
LPLLAPDYIFIEEIKAARLYDQISQAFAALLPVKAVGVMGNKRVHQQVISLRAVQTTDFMTAKIFRFDWEFLERVSTRIVNVVDGVCKVEYDLKVSRRELLRWSRGEDEPQ